MSNMYYLDLKHNNKKNFLLLIYGEIKYRFFIDFFKIVVDIFLDLAYK